MDFLPFCRAGRRVCTVISMIFAGVFCLIFSVASDGFLESGILIILNSCFAYSLIQSSLHDRTLCFYDYYHFSVKATPRAEYKLKFLLVLITLHTLTYQFNKNLELYVTTQGQTLMLTRFVLEFLYFYSNFSIQSVTISLLLFSEREAVIAVIQLVGRLCVMVSLASLSLYSIELFPTIVR